MGLLIVLAIPLVLALASSLTGRKPLLDRLHIAGYAVSALAGGMLLFDCLFAGKDLYFLRSFLFADALNAFFIFTVSVVTFCAALYSAGYLAKDIERKAITPAMVRPYYLLLDLFVFTMLLVLSVNNLGFMWIAIEMTTLVSAFLVGFYRTKESVEASWKYIIVCTVGIIIALIGTILYYYAGSRTGCAGSLNWTSMFSCAATLDKNVLRIAFVFILIGFGTKAGIAPMHTWLPDAHSQAVSPVSALLSGVLLKTALYAIIRYAMILNACLGQSLFSGKLFVLFGLVCLAIASGFVFVQRDLKRLLAYSSIEHIGIICIGLGVGGVLGFCAALLHVFNHAVTKSLMFFSAGRMVGHYGKHSMSSIRGVIRTMPFVGPVFLLGAFALSGFPPFSLFVSELLVLVAAFLKGSYWTAGLVIVFLALMFAGLMFHFSRMLFGRRPEGQPEAKEPLSIKLALLLLLLIMTAAAVAVPMLAGSPAAARLAFFAGG
ncbi:MAG: hydrogenase 4 subunit F [Deltaproteobacteria bacterium]